MHFVVNWESRNALLKAVTEKGLEEAMKPHAWVKPLSDCFIVNVAAYEQYKTATENIIAYARQHPNDLYVLISPPISVGSYLGWLPQTLWPEINKKAV